MRDPRFDILFEPVTIGPVTAKNRFYQTPHCNGMGHLRPQGLARMRGIKAEGGWAVVNTEHCSVHPSGDIMPETVLQLWDDGDIAPLALAADAIHEHGALAGLQLAYPVYANANRLTREVPLGPMDLPVSLHHPVQARAMDKADLRALRGWWRDAAVRARKAGYDVLNVDANYSTVLFQFLSPRNRSSDEYGGSLENRVRLMRELTEVTREAVDDGCAVSIRLIVDELIGDDGMRAADEGLEAIAMLAELPDLWDIVVGVWADDSLPSRFAPENAHEPFLEGIKGVTTRPVLGVGRFTSPGTMASLIRRGVLDMIGAARPSIADPFLPRKIEEGRGDDIRECIGCNICASGHFASTPIRCTQNPTMGEEWRRAWHPEVIAPKASEKSVLVVGAGPAGLECARALGQRGYEVALADRDSQAGGRVTREGALPGLNEWLRVRDWRLGQIGKMPNVALYLESDLGADEVLEFGADHVVLATGATWRRDGIGRQAFLPMALDPAMTVLTPDDVMAGARPGGRVTVYDDDHYYMGSVIAELLAREGATVTLVTPAADISAFGIDTLEHVRVARRLHELGIAMVTHTELVAAEAASLRLADVRTGAASDMGADALVLVTARLPETALFDVLAERDEAPPMTRIGDCDAPAAIFAAVHAGHRFAREFEAGPTYKRERFDLADSSPFDLIAS